jgi:ATP-binding cassette subfamily C protein
MRSGQANGLMISIRHRDFGKTLRNIIQLFFRAEGINPWVVLICLVAASVVEGLGFASLVPLLWTVADPDNAEPSPVLDISRDIMAKLGLSLDIGTLLVFFLGTLVLRSALTFLAMRHVGYAVAEFSTRLRTALIQNLFRAR